MGAWIAERFSTRQARGLVHPIVLTHSTGRGSKGEVLLVYSACGCYGRSAAVLHAIVHSLCVVVVRVFAYRAFPTVWSLLNTCFVCVPFQFSE
jgi:hypothetical protein